MINGRLCLDQKRLTADFLNNIASGWFLLGVITPFLSGIKVDFQTLIRITFPFIFSIIFISIGLFFVKK